MWYVLCLMISFSAVAMEEGSLKNNYYDEQLATSLYEMKDISSKEPLLDQNKKNIFDRNLIREVFQKLSPAMCRQLRSKFKSDMSVQEQVCALEEAIKLLQIHADNFTPEQKRCYEQQIELLNHEKKVLTTYARCAGICTAFWLVCTIFATSYYYLAFS